MSVDFADYWKILEVYNLVANTLYHRYTGCPRRNVQDFGRVFLMLKYTDITQNTYIQSWTVTEIMAREIVVFLRFHVLYLPSWLRQLGRYSTCNRKKTTISLAIISVTVQIWIQVFWVISVYFNIRNTLPKSCTFLLGHPVYRWYRVFVTKL